MSTIAATNLKNASSGSNNIVLNTDGSIGGTCLTQTCRAWVNFNGTGTVAIRASYNVSSITDNGVGVYTVNFTTALADANYSAVVGGNEQGSLTGVIGVTQTLAAGSLQLYNYSPSSILGDRATISVAIFR
jgi:hypothetical protein